MNERVETVTGRKTKRSEPMDIERFVEAPGRKELVQQVREKIDELGMEYLYLQFVSVTGRICGKGIPADHWESVAEKGFQLVYGATMNLFVNRHGDYLGYGPEAPANEISMGSGFLQPTDFEGGELVDLSPALFIATPVLKIVEARLPGPALLTRMMQASGRFPRKGCFVYGGKWMAKPAWPADLRENSLWGTSSNQQFFALGDASCLKEDDYAFFRPTQSEAVLQQFGPVLVFEDGNIVDEWHPLPPG